MFSLLLCAVGALGVLWGQARWIVSAALREGASREAFVQRLQAVVLGKWHLRLDRALERCRRLGADPGVVLSPETLSQLAAFEAEAATGILWGRTSMCTVPANASAILSRIEAQLEGVESQFLCILRDCPWSVEGGASASTLVETERLRARLAALQEIGRGEAAVVEQLRRRRWVRWLRLA
jgi:hypothetical protein